MKITLEPTSTIERIEGQPCRVWVGTTDAGVPVRTWVRCIAPLTEDEAALKAFNNELQELPDASRQAVMFDTRFVV